VGLWTTDRVNKIHWEKEEDEAIEYAGIKWHSEEQKQTCQLHNSSKRRREGALALQ